MSRNLSVKHHDPTGSSRGGRKAREGLGCEVLRRMFLVHQFCHSWISVPRSSVRIAGISSIRASADTPQYAIIWLMDGTRIDFFPWFIRYSCLFLERQQVNHCTPSNIVLSSRTLESVSFGNAFIHCAFGSSSMFDASSMSYTLSRNDFSSIFWFIGFGWSRTGLRCRFFHNVVGRLVEIPLDVRLHGSEVLHLMATLQGQRYSLGWLSSTYSPVYLCRSW